MCNQDAITYLKEKHSVNAEQILPLSFNQWSMWMMQQLSPENPAYNLSLNVHISSPIEIDSMHKAL